MASTLAPAAPPNTVHIASQATDDRHHHHFEFSGAAGEFFKIWIVNIALTIVTIGIYSAWAKVRTSQYFYGSTTLAGGSFQYTANPVAILKGRLVVLAAFVLLQIITVFAPVLVVILYLMVIPAVPWIVIKAIGFKLRYSAYRNIRFHFDGTYWAAFKLYILWTLAIVFTAGLAYPYVAYLKRRFLVDNARYGTTTFRFSGDVGFYYAVYVVAGLLFAAVYAIVFGLFFGGGMLAASVDSSGQEPSVWFGVAAVVGVILAGTLFTLVNAGVFTVLSNHNWQRTALRDVQFQLSLNIGRVTWIQLTNLMLIILSFGLMIPWAKVRWTRYFLSCFTIAGPASLDDFVESEREKLGALGDEFGDAMDLDLGI